VGFVVAVLLLGLWVIKPWQREEVIASVTVPLEVKGDEAVAAVVETTEKSTRIVGEQLL
jgi:hypothetical protein